VGRQVFGRKSWIVALLISSAAPAVVRGTQCIHLRQPLEQLGQCDPQHGSDVSKRSDLGVKSAPFKKIDVRPVKIAGVGEAFLRESLFGSKASDSCPEALLELRIRLHPFIVVDMLYTCLQKRL
jgi:hypothetical protein